MKRTLAGIMLMSLIACTTVGADHVTPLKPGLDLANFDRSIRPQDDLYRFVNGQWLRTVEIPPDRSTFGTFDVLEEQAQENLRVIVEQAARASDRDSSSDTSKVGNFYASFMNTGRLETLGLTPLADEFKRIDALARPEDVVGYMGYSQRIHLPHPVKFYIDQDAGQATSYIPVVYQSGLTLPDRDYYLSADDRYVRIREQYLVYARRLLELGGFADPTGSAQRIMALETRLAEAHWTKVQNQDVIATYNKYTVTAADDLTPGFQWPLFLDGAGVDTSELVISQPSFFQALGAAVTEVPVDDWKLYLKYKLVDEYAPFLTAAFDEAHFDFHSRTLDGVEERRPRWKRAIDALDTTIGEALGRLYVARHFEPEAKRRIDELVSNLVDAFELSIDELEWMGPQTKAEAHDKLNSLAVKIGYPERWKDYSRLVITPDDLVGNLLRSASFEHQRNVDKLGKPIDRTEWFMTPQTVNAYYNASMNEIVFPAAILQPPFFDATAEDAVNYGAIGAVIGHEISHGFDNQGRKYDGDGNLRDWWAPQDQQRFTQLASGLVSQYSTFTPVDDLHVNGELTLRENIGDLSGVAVSFKAYQLSLRGEDAPLLAGFTGEQRFFLGLAQIWRSKYRDEKLRERLLTDSHSPPEYRVNGVVANTNEFYEAFDVKQGDRLYLPPEQRIKIW